MPYVQVCVGVSLLCISNVADIKLDGKMKVKDLITALQNLSDQEAEIVISLKQWNKSQSVLRLPIEYGTKISDYDTKDGYNNYLNTWVTNGFGGSITVNLPPKVYIAGIKD